jgi:hypothetical protein
MCGIRATGADKPPVDTPETVAIALLFRLIAD